MAASCSDGTSCKSWDILANVLNHTGLDNFIEVKVGQNSTWTSNMTSSSDPGTTSNSVVQFANNLTIPTGNVGIGTTSPSYTLHVNGNVAGTSFTNLSDRRYKRDIHTLTDSLTKILAIRGVSYQWIDPDKHGDGTQLGVIAQEIEQIVPEVVTTDKDGTKRVRYIDLIPMIIEAFKTERAQKDAEIAALRAKSEKDSAELRQEIQDLKEALCSQLSHLTICSN